LREREREKLGAERWVVVEGRKAGLICSEADGTNGMRRAGVYLKAGAGMVVVLVVVGRCGAHWQTGLKN
jgi:hypothetical protein